MVPSDLTPEFLQRDRQQCVHFLHVGARLASGDVPAKFG